MDEIRFDAKVDTREMLKFARDLGVAEETMRRDLSTDVSRTAGEALAMARTGAPVFRGTLANGIHLDPLLITNPENGISVSGGISTAVVHAAVQEEGRTPGKRMPPVSEIRRWVELKLRRGDLFLAGDAVAIKSRRRRRRKGNMESRIKGLAFVIARSIGKKGIKGRGFFRKAHASADLALVRRVEETTARWRARLLAGGR